MFLETGLVQARLLYTYRDIAISPCKKSLTLAVLEGHTIIGERLIDSRQHTRGDAANILNNN